MTLPESMAGSVTGAMIEQYRQRNLRNCLIVIVTVIIGWMAAAITPALAQAPVLPTVTALDLQHYAGKWYEIARLPMWFERRCINDVSATYTLQADQTISVLNTCLNFRGHDFSARHRRGSPRAIPWPVACSLCPGVVVVSALRVGRLLGDRSGARLQLGLGWRAKPKVFVDTFTHTDIRGCHDDIPKR